MVDGSTHSEKVFKLFSKFSYDRWKNSEKISATIKENFGSYREGIRSGLVRPL